MPAPESGQIAHVSVCLLCANRVLTHRSKKLAVTSVGAGQECWRDFKAERLGGLEIDHELEPSRLLDRDFARLRAAQNLVNRPRSSRLLRARREGASGGTTALWRERHVSPAFHDFGWEARGFGAVEHAIDLPGNGALVGVAYACHPFGQPPHARTL